MILLIDNYDSFTYNVYQYLASFGQEVKVVRNDKINIEGIKKLNPSKIVISPGPKSPKEAGISVEVIEKLHKEYPILGICLGHQSIAEAFGGVVGYAKELCHGVSSEIKHIGGRLFEGIPEFTTVARYHSLAILEGTLPKDFIINAKTGDGEIMAIEHRTYPLFGLQFHPESIYTPHGMKILSNFVKLGRLTNGN